MHTTMIVPVGNTPKALRAFQRPSWDHPVEPVLRYVEIWCLRVTSTEPGGSTVPLSLALSGRPQGHVPSA